MSAFLTSAGFASRNISFVPCSGLHGDNVTKRSTESTASWYTGPLLVDQLDSAEPSVRAITKPFRLTIDDIFRGGITNPLSVSGRIEAGNLQVGDMVLAMPSGETAIVKALDIDKEASDWAVAGQNVDLHLSEIDSIHLKTGDVLCDQTNPIKNITSFTTKILAFDHVTPMHVDVLRGRLFTSGRVSNLLATLDKSSGSIVKKRPRVLQPGSVARIVVELENAVPLEAPGRVVLRAEGSTVAAGLLE
jgi:elongation factor 1 alpha-like protein